MTDYELLLKKDLWDDGEFIELVLDVRQLETEPYDKKNFEQVTHRAVEQQKLLTLINTSIEARTLRPHSSRYSPKPIYLKEIYCAFPHVDRGYKINRFYQKELLAWGRLKEILPDKLIQWHDQQLKPKQAAATQLESEQKNQPAIDAPAQSEEVIEGKDNQSDTKPKKEGKRNQQVAKIIEIARELGHDPLKLPEGAKAAIEIECLKISLFTPSAFKASWVKANKLGLTRVENYEKYLSNQ